MAVLIATYTSTAGGSERLLIDVATGLDEPPLVACPAGWLAGEARAAGCTVLELPERSLHLRRSPRDRLAAPLRLAAHGRELRRLCRDLEPDLFVAWGMRTALAAAAGLRGSSVPWVFEHVDFLPGAGIARAVRRAARAADRIVCVSEALARDLDPDGALAGRIEVIHCGVDPARFGADAAPGGGTDALGGADPARGPSADVLGGADPARGPSADAGTDATVLVLGAIVAWKRPDLALEIAALAARELPDLRLRIAGAPIDEPGEALLARLRERARQPDLAGRVDFAGRLPDPRSALADAGCLLHCSDREPFGMVLVEALAAGTPVVAPAAGGPAEIVDASCGETYPPGDARAGADALVRVLRNRDALAPGARARVAAAFRLDAMQHRYRALLAETEGVPQIQGLSDRQTGDSGAGIAFVTVSFESATELERLAASIRHHLPRSRLIVVDNGSSDDSVAVAQGAGAQVIALGENRGFGAAANAGVAAVEEPVTVLVNPDVELVDDSLLRLAAQVAPGRLLAPLLLNRDGSRQDSAHPAPASPATALHALVPGPLLPGPLRRAAEPWRTQRPRRVAWATAACLVASTETLRVLGPFDESIFLYGEDLDLGIRAPETRFDPSARVLHSGAHSTARAFGGENHELLARQRRIVVKRNFGVLRALLDDVLELMTFADRALLRFLTGHVPRRETERFRARLKAVVSR